LISQGVLRRAQDERVATTCSLTQSKPGRKPTSPREFRKCATTVHGTAMLAAGGQTRRSPDASDIGAEHDPRDAPGPEHCSD